MEGNDMFGGKHKHAYYARLYNTGETVFINVNM